MTTFQVFLLLSKRIRSTYGNSLINVLVGTVKIYCTNVTYKVVTVISWLINLINDISLNDLRVVLLAAANEQI